MHVRDAAGTNHKELHGQMEVYQERTLQTDFLVSALQAQSVSLENYGLQHTAQPYILTRSHLSSETWQLIQQKAYHWKRLRQIRATVRCGFLRALFEGWRSSTRATLSVPSSPYRFWLKLADHEAALHLHKYLNIRDLVLRAVRDDDRTFFQQFADRHSDESFPNLWKSLRCLLPKASSQRRNNLRCIGPASSDIVLHFNDLEAGEHVGYGALLDQCHRRQQCALSEAPLLVPLEHLPTRLYFEKTCARVKRNKAPGIDGVTPNTLQSCLHGCSEVGFLLVLKSFLLGAEPLQWKGGLMHIIPKKSGIMRADMMRGIMLLTSLGKLYHATLRSLLLPWVTATKIPAQIGGFVGQQTSFATHMLRSFCQLAIRNNLSFGVVFVDVKAAFHSMLREHTFGHSATLPARLQQVLAEAGMNVEQLRTDAYAHARYFEAHPNLCLQRAMQDAHQDTWYTIAGHKGFCQTHRGSRPGSPLADIAYNVAMRNVLHDVLVCLRQIPWLNSLAADLPVFPPLVTWVDDLALPIPALTACELDGHLAEILTLLDSVFRAYGLQLNRQAGKTEVVCQYRGKGAPACRESLFVHNFGRLAMPDGSCVRAVAQYQHLGTSFSQSLSFASELDARLGKASNAFRQLSRGIFRNSSLKPVLRLQLLESLVLSILMYGSGTWPLLSHRQYCKISHAIVGWQRQITGEGYWVENRISDADFLAKWSLPPLSARLAKHRLLYAFQLVRKAPQDLITCVTAEDAADGGSPWCNAVRHAVDWLLMHMPEMTCPQGVATTESLFQWLNAEQHRGPKFVRRCAKRAVLQDRILHDVKLEYSSIHAVCQANGVRFEELEPDILTAARDAFVCHVCSHGFSSVQGLQAHRWRAHGLFSQERKYIFDATCRACNRCFWTTQRLQQHLRWSRRKSNGCFYVLQRNFAPLSEPAHCPCPQDFRKIHRWPACPVEGPSAESHLPFADRVKCAQLEALRLQWSSLGLPLEIPRDVKDLVYRHCDLLVQHWAAQIDDDVLDVDALIEQWLQMLEDADPTVDPNSVTVWAFLQWGRDRLPAIIESTSNQNLQNCLEQAFEDLCVCFPLWELIMQFDVGAQCEESNEPAFHSPDPAADTRLQHDLEPLSRSFLDQRSFLRCFARRVLHWPAQCGVPVVRGLGSRPTLLVLHLFSGRRRDGDCHDMIRKLAPEYFPDFDVLPISADTAIDANLGDLSDGQSFSLLLGLADSGVFALNLTGPPCETWTAARHIVCDNLFGRGPRPLRLCDSPWGVLGLSLRELKQLAMGSHLMLHSIGIELRVLLGGGGSLMEHPATPDDPTFASIWRTDLHRNVVMGCPHAVEALVEQWRYGADCIKPTFLRGIGLPGIEPNLHRFCVPGVTRHKRILAGFDAETRKFRTSAAKEYPSGLCSAMIHASFLSLKDRIAAEGVRCIEWENLDAGARSWVLALHSKGNSHFSEGFLPDYQPVQT
eukprot:s641_g20.t1